MAQYTFTVNDRTASGRNLIQYLNGLSFVRPVEPKKELNAGILEALEDLKRGRFTICSSFDEYLAATR